MLPLTGFAVRDGALVFEDLAIRYGFAKPRSYGVEWSLFDNRAGKPSTRLPAAAASDRVPSEAIGVSDGSYVLSRITAAGARSRHGRQRVLAEGAGRPACRRDRLGVARAEAD